MSSPRRADSDQSSTHRPTVRDVARQAGVSVATVSKVISGGSGTISISDETRTRVLVAARRLNYIPNASARALRRQTCGAVGLFFPAGLHPWVSHVYSELARNLNLSLEAEGQSLVIMTNPPADGPAGTGLSGEPLPHILTSRGVDGVICVHRSDDILLQQLDQLNLPCVLLNAQAGHKHNCVDSDDRAAISMSMEYLYDLGHRRIWFLGLSVGHPSYDIKRKAYEVFMDAKGLPCYPDLSRKIEPGMMPGDYGEWAVEQIFARPRLPSAIVAYNDISALALLHALRERGIRVPEQISILGCDDVPEAVVARPQLSTLRFPAEEMARAAVTMVLNRIRHNRCSEMPVLVRHELVARDSCGAPPTDG